MSKLTICGGGNAAHVLIALAAQAGWEVDVFAPLADEAERLQAGMAANGGMIARSGDETIVGHTRRVSADPTEVVPGSELILLALPALPALLQFLQFLSNLSPVRYVIAKLVPNIRRPMMSCIRMV